MKYLLDTDICIWFLRGRKKSVAFNLDRVGLDSCSISEITKAELLVGVEMELAKGHAAGLSALENFLDNVRVIPVSESLRTFARNKAMLRQQGQPIEDFDLLIGSTAMYYDFVLVTGNQRHMSRIDGIKLEDWTI